MREFHECDCDSCAVNEEHVKQAKELDRLRAEVEELRESERGLRVMNDGLAKWKDELQAKVDDLSKIHIQYRDNECSLLLRIAELEARQLKPGEFVARWEECPRCKGNPERRELIGMDYCTKCEGNGRVAVPVEVEK